MNLQTVLRVVQRLACLPLHTYYCGCCCLPRLSLLLLTICAIKLNLLALRAHCDRAHTRQPCSGWSDSLNTANCLTWLHIRFRRSASWIAARKLPIREVANTNRARVPAPSGCDAVLSLRWLRMERLTVWSGQQQLEQAGSSAIRRQAHIHASVGRSICHESQRKSANEECWDLTIFNDFVFVCAN